MKKKILFLFRHEYEDLWRDGLWKAIQLLSFDYEVTLHNMITGVPVGDYDFYLGWGAFGSPVDRYLQGISEPKGLCIGGVAHPPNECESYNVLFYETGWYVPTIAHHKNIIHAFGINTDIYRPMKRKKFWDYLTVGAFSLWKRQDRILNKSGLKLAVGEIQKGNPRESFSIIAKLLGGGVFISDMVEPERLVEIYNMSKTLYIPADIFGGGERAVLEARACGIGVEVEEDNPKLRELLTSPIYDAKYYRDQLKKGIEPCL